ncbi:hypothetical protein KUTeg_000392 [Tegillarca granosa]|uniref:Uncharacterized protein n=1 Tax=Tegillarca granosa TaxID=220873 RepID=A0ABQ9FXF4_TEGGR|nr:hypothetical protein KUTeg_000392 [Tegillarca granosa]
MVYEKKNSRDPFAVKPFPKAYYHPSKEKRLTSSQRKTALSPSRSGKNEEKKETETTSLDKMFLQKSNSYVTKTHDRDEHEISGSSKFDESWPSSEHPSTINLSEDVSMLSGLKAAGKRHVYVDDIKDSQTTKDKEASWYTKPGATETGESSTLQSESSILSSDQDPAVSTDGLGSTNSGTIVSSIDEQPYRPQFTKTRDYTPHFDGPVGRRITKSARPEDDILYQWRLKRKLETARNSPAPLTSGLSYKQVDKGKTEVSEVESKLEEFKNRLSKLETSVTESPKRTANIQFTAVPTKSQVHENPVPETAKYPIASPTLGRRKKDSDGVDPHLHLMCDVLPCPHQSSYIDTTQQINDIHSLSPIHRVKEDTKQDKRDLELTNQNLCDLDSTNQNPDDSAISDKHIEQQRYKYLKAERPDIEEKKLSDIEEKPIRRSKPSKDDREKKNEKIVSESEDEDSDDVKTIKKRTKVHQDQRSRYSDRTKYNKRLDNSEEDIDDDDDEEEKEKVIRKQEKSKTQQKDSGKIPKLRYSGSPKLERHGTRADAPVEDVIGQVVKTRLFDASASTVMSSVDSLPSFSVTHDTYDSDMEFPEDELLKILRQQRSQYEEKLRKIDHLLSLKDR